MESQKATSLGFGPEPDSQLKMDCIS